MKTEQDQSQPLGAPWTARASLLAGSVACVLLAMSAADAAVRSTNIDAMPPLTTGFVVYLVLSYVFIAAGAFLVGLAVPRRDRPGRSGTGE